MTPILFALNFIACQATHVNQTESPENREKIIAGEKEKDAPEHTLDRYLKSLDEYLESLCDTIGVCDAIFGDDKLCDKICDEICSPITAEEFKEYLKKDCEKM